MNYLNTGNVIFALFLIAVAFVLYKDRKRIKFEGGMFLRRTKRGVSWIENVYSRHKKFWNVYATASYIFTPMAVAFASYWVLKNSYEILSGATKMGAGLVLPSPSSSVVIGSGYIFLPLWLWILGIISIVVPHELSHGLVALSQNIKIKKIGYAFFLFIPAAFVEPDERELKRADPKKKIKIYGAGSFANFLVAMSCILANLILVNAFFYNYGVGFSGLVNNSGAYNVSLNGTITYVNGVRVHNVREFESVMKNVRPGFYVTVVASNRTYKIKTISEGGKTIIGIYGVSNEKKSRIPGAEKILTPIIYIIMWLGILNLGVGLVNMLPIKPLDGGLIIEEFLKGKVGKYVEVANIISIIFAIVLLFNVIGPRLV